MGIIKLSDNETSLLRESFPKLNYDVERNIINGILNFNLKYGETGETIIDEYYIEIDLNHVTPDGIPIIRETEGRILNVAKQRSISSFNLHSSPDGSMCIIIPPKVKERYPHGFDLKELMKHIQEHLYWISYYEKYDKEPWKAYGHGDKGYIELYLEDKEKYSDVFKNHFKCNSRPELRRKLKELKKRI
ncbi:hypothetical protein EZS27_026529 [termite gut metagenome]|uniref:Uncharacterized protein n=1 Tax=termite gut metagenome TaxID=433724 RepID=A0A5J4QTC2_9ZZZZ